MTLVTAKQNRTKASNAIEVSVSEGIEVRVCPAASSFSLSLPGWIEENINPIYLEQLQGATTGLLPAFAHELLLTFKYKEPFLVSIHSDLSITFLI